jgi:hypothetical protein
MMASHRKAQPAAPGVNFLLKEKHHCIASEEGIAVRWLEQYILTCTSRSERQQPMALQQLDDF